ncbi:PAS domain S-box protein [Flavobacterium agrisoli]|uniref:histidine kinase n=1 Tax=Flavobacterium agrisoli TaxID=2793066 RepID=A0A934PNI5_9FLAO|nr:PAS domain S-box protein [Flavobacterium agrisoli]MBK0370130.1 PAS domain S-box protein [Flavobacterium agrisoli]
MAMLAPILQLKTLTNKSLILFDLLNIDNLNDFINKYGYDIPRISILFLAIISLSLFVFYRFISLNHELKQNYYEKYKERESTKKEYHLYFLFIGYAIIISELIFEIMSLRSKTVLVSNLLIGVTITLFYYLFKKFSFLYNKIYYIFIGLFLVYFSYVSYHIVTLKDTVIPSIGFLIFLFFSYNVIKPVRFYYCFIGATVLFLISIFAFQIIPIKAAIILINFSIIIIVINQIRHIILMNVKDKLRFTNEIVQKGNSLIVACNKRGECLYCSDSIETILGYTPEEVMGMEYWRLTEDAEFVGQKYFEEHDEDKLYTRKLKCKNGDYKYIQWKDKRLETDLIIGVGQDITEQYIIRDQFQNLIQTASDLIFEMDNKGHFTFVNNFALKTLNYRESDVIGKHYTFYISKKYQNIAADFYENLENIQLDFPIIELPLLKKNGQEVWVSQKVIVRKNEFGKIIGFSGIARDITTQKTAEQQKNLQLEKKIKYTEIIKRLTTTDFTIFKNANESIAYILNETAINNDICGTTYWSYKPEEIRCKLGCSKDPSFKIDLKAVIKRIDFPVYFEAIENKTQIIVSDVLSKYETSEFSHDYLDQTGVRSLIDSAVYVNGQLYGILCFESKTERKWDTDDAYFSKTIADIISLGIATHKRLKQQKKLKDKTRLLAAVAKCTENFLSNESVDDMFNLTFQTIGKASRADRMTYYEKDNEGLFVGRFLWTLEKGTETKVLETKFTEGECSEIIKNINNSSYFQAKTKDLDDSVLKKYYIQKNILCMVLLPIYENDHIKGFLGLSNCTSEKKLSKDQLLILQTLANNISNFLERTRNQQRVIESEQRFKLIVNNIPGTAYLSKFDQNASKVYLNDTIEALTGYSKEEFLKNKISFLDLIHPIQKAKIINQQMMSIRKGKSIHSKYQIKRKSGEYIWIEEYADVIKNDEIIEYVGGIYFELDKSQQFLSNINSSFESENLVKKFDTF